MRRFRAMDVRSISLPVEEVKYLQFTLLELYLLAMIQLGIGIPASSLVDGYPD